MKVLSVLLLASSTLMGGCVTATVGAVGAVGIAAIQDRTIGEALDDGSASNQIKSRLFSAGPKRFTEVDVEVANKIALLSGRVSTPEDKVEASRIAWSVSIVDDVANEIQVREPGGVRHNAKDEWITARVRSKLFTDSVVKSMNINVETYDATVYLMGLARSADELQRAAQLASRVRGVKEVVSFMEVRQPRPLESRAPQQQSANPYDPQQQY